MDQLGIERVINRINEIESEIDTKLGPALPPDSIPADASFSNTLQSVMASQLASPPANQIAAEATFFPMTGGAIVDSNQMIDYKGHKMTSKTAGAFRRLEELINRAFPGRAVTITSTTDGHHDDPNHAAGKAIDFVVDGLTQQESRIVEDLARQAGFAPFNEYIYSSRLKTGNHMHVDLSV